MELNSYQTDRLKQTAANLATIHAEIKLIPAIPTWAGIYPDNLKPTIIFNIPDAETLNIAADVLFLDGWTLTRTSRVNHMQIEEYSHPQRVTVINLHVDPAAYTAPTA